MPDELDRFAAQAEARAQATAQTWRAEWKPKPNDKPKPAPSRPGGLLTETECHRANEARLQRQADELNDHLRHNQLKGAERWPVSSF